MDRTIIDLPAFLTRALTHPWQIDWRSQGAGETVDGQEQIVFSRLPRWQGALSLKLHGDALLLMRGKLAEMKGRANALRVRMLDPLAGPSWGGDYGSDLAAFLGGVYVEHRPQVTLAAAVTAGASTILINEGAADRPVRVGQRVSIADWPVEVTARAIEAGGTRLTVAPFARRAADLGDPVDLIPRGLFVLAGDAPDLTYARQQIAMPTLNLVEWVTRA